MLRHQPEHHVVRPAVSARASAVTRARSLIGAQDEMVHARLAEGEERGAHVELDEPAITHLLLEAAARARVGCPARLAGSDLVGDAVHRLHDGLRVGMKLRRKGTYEKTAPEDGNFVKTKQWRVILDKR